MNSFGFLSIFFGFIERKLLTGFLGFGYDFSGLSFRALEGTNFFTIDRGDSYGQKEIMRHMQRFTESSIRGCATGMIFSLSKSSKSSSTSKHNNQKSFKTLGNQKYCVKNIRLLGFTIKSACKRSHHLQYLGGPLYLQGAGVIIRRLVHIKFTHRNSFRD